MNYAALIEGMKRFGSTERDICIHGIGVPPEQVQECVWNRLRHFVRPGWPIYR